MHNGLRKTKMLSQRGFLATLLTGAGFVLLGFRLQPWRSHQPVPIGDGLVILDGWILRAADVADLAA